ncbi:late embryogenesis abundant protein 1-like [Phoenix dactylifera]|uniref:Late embryogenesis abundant protein 1-like n=1 Tax=Phoenix dactylifera TaxID=42345 RepID=A0A8B7CCP1_PHODC|nr:late embryogenesis abundant protein 1-like [Phoenix dactylifera]
MSSTQQTFRGGKAHGEGQAKADQMIQSAKDTAHSITGGSSDTRQCAQENKEQAAGFLQQTGEQVKQMAQGAMDAVKNATGMGNASSGTTTTPTSKH